jgi:UDP:flavonoid glycosyltransferase YjiC (YdhE family)
VMSPFVDKPYSDGAVHFAPAFDVSYILPHCVYYFSHGGINAVMESLGHGVPLIMVPGAIHERRHNAREVTAVDCGILIEVEDFTVPQLSSLLLDQTQELALRGNARRMQELIEETGGMKAAFEAMEEGWLRPYPKEKLTAIGRRLQSL